MKPIAHPRIFRVLVLLALACGLSGCRPANPLNQTISANSAIDHNLWRSNVSGSLSQEQWLDFDTAIQELRLKIMAEHIAVLTADVDAALLAKINKRPVCEILHEGFEFKLGRLNQDRVEALRVFKIDSALRTKPGDFESANFLKNRLQEETADLAALEAKIATAQEKMQKYDPAVGSTGQIK